jgi:NTE family protein
LLPSWLHPWVPKPMRLLEQVAIVSLVGRDQAYLNQPSVKARSMTVDSRAVGFLDFHLNQDQVDELYADGQREARRFLSTWDWEEYLARYRR